MIKLRNVLTGAAIRAIAGIQDMGEVIAGFVANIDGGPVTETASDNSDVHVHVREASADAANADGGRPIKGRLFVPLDIMWRLPKGGESVTVLRPADADGPGVALVLFGDGGPNAPAAPSWLGPNDCGISAPETFHVESTNGGLTLKDKSGASITFDGNGNITVQAAAPNGSVTVTATPGTGAVKLGPNGNLQVLVLGAQDAIFGAPIIQAPAAVASIVSAG